VITGCSNKNFISASKGKIVEKTVVRNTLVTLDPIKVLHFDIKISNQKNKKVNVEFRDRFFKPNIVFSKDCFIRNGHIIDSCQNVPLDKNVNWLLFAVVNITKNCSLNSTSPEPVVRDAITFDKKISFDFE